MVKYQMAVYPQASQVAECSVAIRIQSFTWRWSRGKYCGSATLAQKYRNEF
jgi:hypothetical protein